MSTTIDETAAGLADGAEGFALEQPYEVPSESAFRGKEFIIDAADLKTIARDLIDQCEEFWHLRGAGIEYAWKRKGGMSGGATLYHGHKRSDTHAVAHGAKEFLIWIAADIAREQPFTARDVEAAMFHELCFPGDTEVLGPHVEGAIARWYAGEMVEIRTAGGRFLSGTPNHPILTHRGWIPLDLVQEGDYVLGCADPQRVVRAVDPDEDHVPARIEQIAHSGLVPLRRMPETAEDFDSDIPDRQVDVVDADRALLGGAMAESDEHVAEVVLGGRNGGLVTLSRQRSPDLRGLGMALSGPRGMRGGAVRDSLLGSHPCHAEALGLAARARFDAECAESVDHRRSGAPGALPEGLGGLAGLVAFDQIRDVQRRHWAGHVYNLQTGLEWYVANGIIAHNCHLGWNENAEEVKIVGHPVEYFPSERRRYGLPDGPETGDEADEEATLFDAADDDAADEG